MLRYLGCKLASLMLFVDYVRNRDLFEDSLCPRVRVAVSFICWRA